MPTFVTIGYGDRKGYDRAASSVLDAAHAHDKKMQDGGAVMGIAGTPTQVRNPGGSGTRTTQGPFLTAAMPVAGFALIEAESLEKAIEMVSKTPCAVAHGVVEVWPLEQPA